MKRSELKRGTKKLERKGRLNPVSSKTKERQPARAACVAAVIARDRVCQFWPMVDIAKEAKPPDVGPLPPCSGKLTAHEPGHRRNVDCTDPDECLAMCWGHNGWIEDHPEFGYATGLLIRGNGLPLRKALS